VVAGIAWSARALTLDGAIAAAAVGTAALCCPLGWRDLAVLAVYFVTSTVVVSRLAARDPSSDKLVPSAVITGRCSGQQAVSPR